MLSPAIYQWLNGFSPFLVAWTFFFTLLTTTRIIIKQRQGVGKVKHNSTLTELAGLPLAVLQSACFYKAVVSLDILSMLLFLWWGPGFIFSLAYYFRCKAKKVKANWYPYRRAISWLCKANYFAFLVAFATLHLPALIFVYSAWIINDQYGLAFLSLDADRLRRTFHDYWVVRIFYPLGLFAPFVYPSMPYALFYQVFGTVLFILWIAGIIYVSKKTSLTELPKDSSLLRNMIYLPKPDK